jgi:hypothetical protein
MVGARPEPGSGAFLGPVRGRGRDGRERRDLDAELGRKAEVECVERRASCSTERPPMSGPVTAGCPAAQATAVRRAASGRAGRGRRPRRPSRSFETVLFEIPESPIACTSSSTRLVEAPPIPFAIGLEPMAARWLTLDLLQRAPSPRCGPARESPGSTNPGAASAPAVQRPQSGVECPVTVAAAAGDPPIGALMATSADQTFDTRFHDQLENCLSDRKQEISLVVLLKQLGKRHGGLIIGGSSARGNSTTTRTLPTVFPHRPPCYDDGRRRDQRNGLGEAHDGPWPSRA